MQRTDLTIQGFEAAAVKARIRGKDRLDIGLIVSRVPAVAAAVYTTSLVKAAPVLLGMEKIKSGKARAIMVNSGIANACTGEQGMENARGCARLLAEALEVSEDQVHVSSTGVIGMQLDMANFTGSIPALVEALSENGFDDVSRAMMTTDTVPKTALRDIVLGGKQVKILGLAKGSGMIMPNMATMLCFLCTDVVISPELLQKSLTQAVNLSFNRITVDGDTSTNDTALILANGLAKNFPVDDSATDTEMFQAVLNDLLKDLALQIVRDGEGATKLITIRVDGAKSMDDAKNAALTVANSALVKTAFFGEDANWGRIIGALGRSGAMFDPCQVDIAFDQVLMVKDGLGQGRETEVLATEILKKKEFSVNIHLKAGQFSYEEYTCDFSIDYVKINADYRS
ncbi:MAG: bifunctional glutamate N-acetyltransferase/amino-acid acetyltransferase ArgJ [Proteobacteria bacterium]|nr:bifunctional glutamate N-acetyltransferase/amino-acid acetyltransferase ArgJ [Pseudomonadota bacterium]MBU1710796.1 bifunctional glutamate N-acetyltransferase/amino-acid acetyltransferase ArgJ [Pseudomonadota bacterium]